MLAMKRKIKTTADKLSTYLIYVSRSPNETFGAGSHSGTTTHLDRTDAVRLASLLHIAIQ